MEGGPAFRVLRVDGYPALEKQRADLGKTIERCQVERVSTASDPRVDLSSLVDEELSYDQVVVVARDAEGRPLARIAHGDVRTVL